MDLTLTDILDDHDGDTSSSITPYDDLITRAQATAGDDLQAWLKLAHQARQESRLAEAQALLLAANARFPNKSDILLALGRAAESQRDWVAAERWWRQFSDINPHIWWGFAAISRSMREQGRSSDADTVMADLRDRFPDEAAIFIDHAWQVERRRDWPAALQLWTEVASRFPTIWDGFGGQGRVLRELGRNQEAEAILVDVVARFPSQPGPLRDLAKLTEATGNCVAAEKYWRAFIAIDAGHWWAHTGLATAVREQGRLREAKALLASVIDRFPEDSLALIEVVDQISKTNATVSANKLRKLNELVSALVTRPAPSPGILIAHALIARERREWVTYQRRLHAAYQQYPSDVRLRTLLSEANAPASGTASSADKK
jgi:tetratricopeptide (TPR) repeat protein